MPDRMPQIPLQPTAPGGRHVLLVDDNAINRELAMALLKKLGLRVTVAVNGLDAVERATNGQFDLVLMDIQMPLMDGLEATRRIREYERHSRPGSRQVGDVQDSADAAATPRPPRPLPIVAMTAHASADDRLSCLAAGMNDHLIKPIDPGRLAHAVERWIAPAAEPRPDGSADRLFRPPAAPPASPSVSLSAAVPAGQPGATGLPLDLPPFDIPAALQRCHGNHDLLLRLIRGFAEHFGHAGQTMRALIAAAQWVEAKALAHSLTGVAASLELRVLADTARLIDLDLNDARYALLPTRVSALEAALDQAVRAARSAQVTGIEAGQHQTPGDTDALAPWEQDADLEEFRRHLRSNSFRARRDLARIAPHLRGRDVDEEFAIIAAEVDRLDFAAASAALDRLIERLKDASTAGSGRDTPVTQTLARILVVDDEPIMIEMIAAIFSGEIEVLFATNGEMALRIAGAELPDLILLDVVMPGIDGFEVCARLKVNPLTADIPVIFITGLGDTLAETRGLAMGAMDYINKPINPPVVEVRVRNQIALKNARDQLTKLAITDGLTGLANRRRFDDVMEQEYARHQRTGAQLSIAMLDVDHFKLFNDTYGHLRGDNTLRLIAQVIDDSILRASDLAARYGGEEFACILPDTGPPERAVAVAERIIKGVNDLAIAHAASPIADHVTVSIGLVTRCCDPETSPESLVRLADEQLYRAKASGRNRVCIG